jgi:hypothetical protein
LASTLKRRPTLKVLWAVEIQVSTSTVAWTRPFFSLFEKNLVTMLFGHFNADSPQVAKLNRIVDFLGEFTVKYREKVEDI